MQFPFASFIVFCFPPCYGAEVFLFFSCIFKKDFVPLIKLKTKTMGTEPLETDIYLLCLHEKIIKDDYEITRVASGWIYRSIRSTDGMIFVPFDNRFQD